MLKKYSDLNFSDRNMPCQEYPGSWIICSHDSSNLTIKMSLSEAYEAGRLLSKTHNNVYIFWLCSNNDPRIKESWFNQKIKHGQFNIYSGN